MGAWAGLDLVCFAGAGFACGTPAVPVGATLPPMGGWVGTEVLRVPAMSAVAVPPLTVGWLAAGALPVPAVPDGDALPPMGGWVGTEVLRVPAVSDGDTPPLTVGWLAAGALPVPAVPDSGAPPLTGGWLAAEALPVPAVPDGDALQPMGGWVETELLRVPAPSEWPRSLLPEAPTPGGGEILDVPFCRMGLDGCPTCWALVCVLIWVAEAVDADAVCTVEVRLEAPLGGCPPPEEGILGFTLFWHTRGIGGRSGVSCRDWAVLLPTFVADAACSAVGADIPLDGRGVFCHTIFTPGGAEVRRAPRGVVRCAFAPLPGTGCWVGCCPDAV